MQRILNSIRLEWREEPAHDEGEEGVAVLLDDGISETLKWNVADRIAPEASMVYIPILPLRLSREQLNILSMARPKRLLILSSELLSPSSLQAPSSSDKYSVIDDVFDIIASVAKFSPNLDVILLSTCSFDIFGPLLREDDEMIFPSCRNRHITLQKEANLARRPERWRLESGKTSIKLMQVAIHSLKILSPPDHADQVGVFVLSSLSCRNICPLSLHQLALWDYESHIKKSVNDVAAEDLPASLRATLKHLAHEVASSTVYDYGLDASGSIFTMGKTASLVGYTLQESLANVVAKRDSGGTVTVGGTEETSGENRDALSSCTLLLVDRSVDLFTPCQHDTSSSLAHKILSLLPRQGGQVSAGGLSEESSSANLTDITLLQRSYTGFFSSDERKESPCERPSELLVPPLCLPATGSAASSRWSEEDCSASRSMLHPMSAVSQLPFALLPSLSACPQTRQNLQHALFAEKEEVVREVLSSSFEEVVKQHSRASPKRKKGLGAELLAYVQAAASVSSKGSKQVPSGGFDGEAVDQNVELFSFAIAIIEAMQRSSSKQLSAHLLRVLGSVSEDIPLASFEMRCQMETALWSSVVKKSRGDMSPAFVIQCILESCGLDSKLRAGSPHVVDLKHCFLVTASVFSWLGREFIDESDPISMKQALQSLAVAIASHIVNKSLERDILDLNLLATDVVDEIIQCRKNLVEGPDSFRNKLTDIVEDEILAALAIVVELSSHSHSCRDFSSDENSGRCAGVLAHTLRSILASRLQRLSRPEETVQPVRGLTHVEDPLFSIARAGLGMLSQGLGSWGFGSASTAPSAPHPSQNNTLVLFVIGGVSAVEIQQLQDQLASFQLKNFIAEDGNGNEGERGNAACVRVLIGSTSLLGTGDVYQEVFVDMRQRRNV